MSICFQSDHKLVLEHNYKEFSVRKKKTHSGESALASDFWGSSELATSSMISITPSKRDWSWFGAHWRNQTWLLRSCENGTRWLRWVRGLLALLSCTHIRRGKGNLYSRSVLTTKILFIINSVPHTWLLPSNNVRAKTLLVLVIPGGWTVILFIKKIRKVCSSHPELNLTCIQCLQHGSAAMALLPHDQ